MLGKLCKWIRMAGYDCIMASGDMTDNQVIKESDGRILLTRDKELAFRAGNAFLVVSSDPTEQYQEVRKTFGLVSRFPGHSRCRECNTPLKKVSEKPAGVPPKVRSKEYWVCPKCGKVYWEGKHWEGIKKVIG